jgi:hypothetical protein
MILVVPVQKLRLLTASPPHVEAEERGTGTRGMGDRVWEL